MNTRSQKLAQEAYQRIAAHVRQHGGKQPEKEFVTTVKRFPALIHACGLAQAVAFALAKKDDEYVGCLAAVLQAAGYPELTGAEALATSVREQPLSEYLRLSRDALNAAGWLKRYAEAAGEAS